MGYRKFMQDIAGISEASKGFAESTTKLRQQAAREAFQKQMPELLSEGDPNKIAAAAAQAGDLDFAEQVNKALLSQKIAEGKQKPKFGEQELVSQGLSPEQAKQAAGLSNFEAQREFIGNVQQSGQLQFAKGAEERRIKTDLRTAKTNFAKPLNEFENKIDDSFASVRGSLKQFKTVPNKATRQGLAVSMARALGDTGVLSNQDLNTYNLNTIASDVEGLKAYLTNTPSDSIPDSVVNSLSQMAEGVIGNAEERKKFGLKNRFQQQVSTYGEDLIQDGKKNDVVKAWEKKLGVDVTKAPTGEYQIKGTKPTDSFAGDYAQGASMAGQIKDPKIKQFALDAIKKFQQEGKPIPDSVLTKIRGAIGE